MNLKILLILLLITVSSYVFAADTIQNNQAKNVYTEDHLNIIVKANDPQFTIKLKSNPTTGYAWYVRKYDANLILPIKHQFQKSNQNLMGAPGEEWWVFRVKPNGFLVPHQTTIRFIYARPWEGENNATQIVFYVTTVSA